MDTAPLLQEVADKRLHSRVDVGTVEGGDAALRESKHVPDRGSAIYYAMATRQLPPALDKPWKAGTTGEENGLHA